MFGYIRIQKSELLVREYEAYKSVYCGLCRQMGRDYSRLSRFILSYDCTFYAIFLMSLRRSCTGFERKCCRFNPLKRCTYCSAEDDALSKAAALSVILAYYKTLDDIADSGFFKRTAYRIVKPIFARWRKKAARRYPELDKIAADMTAAQQLAEKDSNCPLDKAADPSATMLSSVLALEAESESKKRIYSQIGYGLGRFIYLVDAADDLEKDIKNGNFNPFVGINDRNNVIKNNLSQALAMTFDAYNLLDLVGFKGIIDNVITKGLPTVQNEILTKIST
ncbi:MAG: hypothetical protein J1E96_06365 [Ruminococcus sp.]|nr:hypothetical protein [Ruminococcus sp.]